MKIRSGSTELQMSSKSLETLLKPSQFHVIHLKDFTEDATEEVSVLSGEISLKTQ